MRNWCNVGSRVVGLVGWLASGSLATSGCIERGPGPQPKRIAPSYVRAHLLDTIPSTEAGLSPRLDVALGAYVLYLGNIVDRTQLTPGEAFQLKHYYRVVATPPAGWQLFTHLHGAAGHADFLNADVTDMRKGHPPTAWRPGQIIEDIQNIELPAWWRAPTVSVRLGMFPLGKHGVRDRAPIVHAQALDHALLVRQFAVDLSRVPPPNGTIVVKRTLTPLVIDGIDDEPAWRAAMVSPEFVTAEGGQEPPGSATAKLTWDDAHLYVYARIVDNDIYSPYTKHDDPLWKADCIELFIDADNNRRGYVELQWNPNNAQFDSWFVTTRNGPAAPDFDAHSLSAVTVKGTPQTQGDRDEAWTLEVAIPWKAVRGNDPGMEVVLPPKPGSKMRLNVVRVDVRGQTTAASWNRITIRDFHAIDRMLNVVFADHPEAAPIAPTVAP